VTLSRPHPVFPASDGSVAAGAVRIGISGRIYAIKWRNRGIKSNSDAKQTRRVINGRPNPNTI
jgi:hypothetical protein